MSVLFDERYRRSVLDDLASADAEARRLAVERVVALPLDEAIALLVERLGDPSWRVRKAVVERFQGLLEAALRPRKSRRATAPTRASKEARLSQKRRQSRRKAERTRPEPDA